MSPKPWPKAPSAGRQTSIALETEPLVFFHPTLAGLSPPGTIQPIEGTVLLEEEPATWPQLAQSSEARITEFP